MRHAAVSRGFTLVEVLVALVVVALGMGALLAALTSAAGQTAQLRQRMLAQWVGLNLLATARLQAAPPSLGKSDGSVELAGQRWRWQQQVLDAGMAELRRVELTVRAGDAPDVPVAATVVGFVGPAAVNRATPGADWSGNGPRLPAGGAGGPADSSVGAPPPAVLPPPNDSPSR